MANKVVIKRTSVAGREPIATDIDVGELAVNLADKKLFTKDGSGTVIQLGGGSGTGDVEGPVSSTDNALARYDGTTGKLIQNSVVTVSDTGAISGAESISNLDFAQFDTTVTPVEAVAKLQWDDGNGTFQFGLKGGNTNLQVGQEIVARVYNDSGVALSDGQIVYISGAQGNRVAVKLALATTDGTSAGTLGMVTEPIAIGGEGFITVMGTVNGLNTTGLTQGAILYLSPTVAGAYTATKPTAPQHTVTIGYVERVDNIVGSIYVKVDNGYELDELHNVLITSPTSGNTLIYDASVGVWENANITGGTGLSVTNGAGTIALENTGVTSAVAGTGITVSGATGAVTITNNDRGSSQNIFKNIAVSGQSDIVADTNNDTVTVANGTGISLTTNSTTDTLTITNTAPDQTVTISGGGTTTVGGTYPNFTVTSADQFQGTVTSVAVSGGTTGLTTSGGPITGSGTITIAGTLAVANGGTGSTTAATARTALSAQETLVSGTNIKTVNSTSILGSGNIAVGTVTGVTGTSPIISSGGTAPAISISAATTSAAGSMSAADKTKLDGIATGATANTGTVTSVNGTGTVNGITLSGTVTSSGNLTLGGTLSGVSLSTQVTGTLPIANGGTGATTASQALTNLGAYPSSNPSGYTSNAGTVTSITAGTGLTGGTITTSGTVALANTGVSAGSYTNASITVDAQGRLTSASSGSGGGVSSISAGSGISVNASTGAVTVTNTSPNIVTATSGSAPYYAARAWVNFNGTGSVAIRESRNVSSITDYGTGSYGVNYTTAMPIDNNCVVAQGTENLSGDSANGSWFMAIRRVSGAVTAGQCRVSSGGSGSAGDFALVTVATFA